MGMGWGLRVWRKEPPGAQAPRLSGSHGHPWARNMVGGHTVGVLAQAMFVSETVQPVEAGGLAACS